MVSQSPEIFGDIVFDKSDKSKGLQLINYLRDMRQQDQTISWIYHQQQFYPTTLQLADLKLIKSNTITNISIEVGPVQSENVIKAMVLANRRAQILSKIFQEKELHVEVGYNPSSKKNSIKIQW
jgi:hypothetical protein